MRLNTTYDENLPYEIEDFLANYDYPIGGYAESFGADDEEEEEDITFIGIL